MRETWKYIKNYEGIYEVSSAGSVRNARTNKIKTGSKSKDAWYIRLNLCKDGVCKSKYIHRLVAESFIPNPENKSSVNHINGIKGDNSVENLEWCTHKENTNHAWKLGLMENVRSNFKGYIRLRGEKNRMSKLTDKDVIEIREKYKPGKNRYQPGCSIYQLAKEYKISKSKVQQIIKRQCWNHI